MTFRELSQLYWLRREISVDTERLAEFRGRGGDASRSAEVEEIIREKRGRCAVERERLERYIASVPDSYIRQALVLRFERGLSWVAVAMRLGGDRSGDGVRKLCKRYLDRFDKNNGQI